MHKKCLNKNSERCPLLHNRKAQGISINVIIIAAIALMVLVIISIIFIGRMGKTREEIDKCQTNGGTCAEDCAALGEYSRETSSYKCYYGIADEIPEGKKVGDANPDLKCCIKI